MPSSSAKPAAAEAASLQEKEGLKVDAEKEKALDQEDHGRFGNGTL